MSADFQSVAYKKTYLAGADFVESHKGKGLGEHCRGQVLFGESERKQDCREEQLRQEGPTLWPKACRGCAGRRGVQVEQNVVRRKVVAVVRAREMVKIAVLEEGQSVAVDLISRMSNRDDICRD